MFLFSIDLPLILTSYTKEKLIGLVQKANTKAATVLKLRELGETPGTTPVEVYARVRGTSSPSRSFHESVHLSAFLFASFPSEYESTIR